MTFGGCPTTAVHSHFDEVRALCDASTNPTVNQDVVPANRRIDGLLIGDGDVVYLRVAQPANQKMFISVDVLAAQAIGGNVDFDLYVSTVTSTPDNGSYSRTGMSSTCRAATTHDGALSATRPVTLA